MAFEEYEEFFKWLGKCCIGLPMSKCPGVMWIVFRSSVDVLIGAIGLEFICDSTEQINELASCSFKRADLNTL